MTRFAPAIALALASLLLVPTGSVSAQTEEGEESPDGLSGRVTLLEAIPVARQALEDDGDLLQISATIVTSDGHVDMEEGGTLTCVFATPEDARAVILSEDHPDGMTLDHPASVDRYRPLDEDRLLDSPELTSGTEEPLQSLSISSNPDVHETAHASMIGDGYRMVNAYTGEPIEPEEGR